MDDATAIRFTLIVCVADLILGSILAAGSSPQSWPWLASGSRSSPAVWPWSSGRPWTAAARPEFLEFLDHLKGEFSHLLQRL